MAMLRCDTFRMELHAVDRQGFVPESHYMAIVAGRVDDKLGRYVFNNQ